MAERYQNQIFMGDSRQRHLAMQQDDTYEEAMVTPQGNREGGIASSLPPTRTHAIKMDPIQNNPLKNANEYTKGSTAPSLPPPREPVIRADPIQNNSIKKENDSTTITSSSKSVAISNVILAVGVTFALAISIVSLVMTGQRHQTMVATHKEILEGMKNVSSTMMVISQQQNVKLNTFTEDMKKVSSTMMVISQQQNVKLNTFTEGMENVSRSIRVFSQQQTVKLNAVTEGMVNVSKAIQDAQQKIDVLKAELQDQRCKQESGLLYNGICYFASHLSSSQHLNHDRAVQNCSSRSANLAEIHSLAQHKEMENFFQPKIPSSRTYIYMWIGTTYNSSRRILKFRSGKEVSVDQFRWDSGFPSGSRECMVIEIGNDGDSDIGLWNTGCTSAFYGVLCEKSL